MAPGGAFLMTPPFALSEYFMDADTLTPDARPKPGPHHMFRWEPSQNAWLLLYPEGVVKLNAVAGEILKRCDGERSVEQLMTELVALFDAPADTVRDGTRTFLTAALDKGWVAL
jgi:pyrroloquinoline quinone biosynthesis protein D